MEELVRKAISFEQKGRKFYEEMSSESCNELAKELFSNLADDEESHEQWIMKYCSCDESVESTRDGLTPANTDSIEERMQEVFDRLQEKETTCEMDNVDGLNMAMQLEEKAIDMYRELINKKPSAAEREFLEKILKEEREHLEALRNVYFYLTKTGDWFHEQESTRWNWMNI